MSYGNIIKKLRNEKNMTLRDFGKFVGISHTHIMRLENEFSDKGKDKLSVPIDSLKQICDHCGYSFRQFLEEAGYIEPVINLNSELDEIYSQLSPDNQKLAFSTLQIMLELQNNQMLEKEKKLKKA